MTEPATISDDAALAAFARRDRAFDGRFVVGVRTTLIYCRPSCPARRPAPGNAAIFADGAAAQAAGYRPCLRCRPDAARADAVAIEAAAAAIRAAKGPVTLDELAQLVGYSRAHLQRVFKRDTGMTPAQYGRALRRERATTSLSNEDNVTGAIYAAGYSAPSRFYAEHKGRLGMSASAWIDGGADTTIRWAVAQTSLGALLVAATDVGVCRVAFGEDEADLRARFPNARIEVGDTDLIRLVADVVAAVETGDDPDAIPLDVRGTAFQERVWAQLRAIPRGETRTYGEIAAALGQPGASRAVGSANGANPVAVLTPCHRVVRAGGNIGGYAYGPEIKRALLERERE